MFCPKCSQQQTSDETRFCSGCGFELGVVKALLSSQDSGPTSETTTPVKRSMNKRDATVGAFLMFVAAFIAAAITIDMPASHSSRILLLAIGWLLLTFLLNIKPIIGYFLRADNSDETTDFSVSKTIAQFASRSKNALPEATGIPASDFVMPRVNTAEMVKPPSVTERTTNLLEKD